VLFELVDFDSRGNRMRDAIESRARMFAAQLGGEIVLLALTREQVDEHAPPRARRRTRRIAARTTTTSRRAGRC
jgi:hypothetical protein